MLRAAAVYGRVWAARGLAEVVGLSESLYTAPMNYRDIITIEPGKRGGKPCIRGMRITVYDVLSYMAAGMTEQEILSDFPELTHTDILACLGYAADREQRLLVVLLGLDHAADVVVWQHARDHGYTIATKDADFSELSTVFGAPAKVVWIRRGNCTTDSIETLLRQHVSQIAAMLDDSQLDILAIE